MYRRARALRLGDHLDDLRQQGIGADFLGPHQQAARTVDGGADQTFSGHLAYRDRLTRNHGLVDAAVALDHLAIDRHLFTRSDSQDIAYLHVLQRDVFLLAIRAHQARGLGCQPQQQLDGGIGLAARA